MSRQIDIKLLFAAVALVLFGTVMVYSASTMISYKRFGGDMNFFLVRQLLKVFLSFVGLIIAASIDYRKWRKLSPLILGASVVLILATLTPYLGGSGAIKGARRWINIFGWTIQPSEFAKLALIMFVATRLSCPGFDWKNIRKVSLTVVLPVALVLGMILIQPNIGMAVGLSLVILTMFVVAGMPKKYLVIMLVGLTVAIMFVVVVSPYARARILAFLFYEDPTGHGYQTRQSLIALGSGGFFGEGLGKSFQKLLFLPEVHTDFVFAIIGDELGFLGCAITIFLIGTIVYHGIKIAVRAKDMFGMLLAFGISAEIFYFSAINIAVVTKLIPTTGIPLPFVSYGGSQLLVHMFSVGILLNISRYLAVSLNEKPIKIALET
ncbi:putative lipid II flippase FtsW [bacterium]|nr:putative lipid II flippase FtsW [bacterium]